MDKSLVIVACVDIGARNAPAIHVLNIAKQMALLGHNVTLIVPRPSSPLPVALPDKKVRLVLTPNLTRFNLPNSLNALFQIPYLFRTIRKPHYIRSSPLSLPLVLLARLFGSKPVVIECNGWFSDELKLLGSNRVLTGLFEFLQLSEARLANRIRVVTQGLGDILTSNNIPRNKITIIENAADIDVFVPVSRKTSMERLQLRASVRYMAFIGNLWPAVDLKTIFEAMKLLDEGGQTVELLVAGGGRSADHFKRLAKDYQVDGLVHFLGSQNQSELKYILGGCDFAIAPLFADRNERIGVSPLKVYEYAASGTPVIATRLPGIVRLDSEAWISLVPPGDVDGWVTSIREMLDKENLNELGEQSRHRAETEFGWNHRARQIDSLIHSND